jgi:hypothetical protein
MPRSRHAAAASTAYSRKGDAAAAERLGRPRDRLGRGAVGERVDLARLGDVPVLAEGAGEIAAGGAERQDRRAGQEVRERLLLDGIHAEAARAAPRGQHDAVAVARAHEAQTALPVREATLARAHVALQAAVGERSEVAACDDRPRGAERRSVDDLG